MHVLALRLPLTGYSAQTIWAFVALALVSQCIGHTTYNWALKWFSAGIIAAAHLLGRKFVGTQQPGSILQF